MTYTPLSRWLKSFPITLFILFFLSALPALVKSQTIMADDFEVCSGSGTKIMVVPSNAGFKYQLRNNIDNSAIGSPVNGTGGGIYLPTGNLTTSATFNVLAINTSTLVETTLSGTASVIVNPLPDITLPIGGPGLICSGATATITLPDAEAFIIYELRNNDNNALIDTKDSYGGSLSLSATNVLSTTTYKIVATNMINNCSAQLTNTNTVNIIDVPANPIIGPVSVCPGSTHVAYSVTTDHSATASYQWSYSGTGATLSSTTGPAITIDFASNATAGSLKVVETITATGCSKTNTKTDILFSPPVVGTITEPSCTLATGSVVLNGLPASGTWTINPGGITGTGTSTTINGLSPGTYNYTVTDGNTGCTSLPSGDVVPNGLGKSWASPHDGYFVWYQDDPANRYRPTILPWTDGVTAGNMSAGSGVTLTIASDGGTVFKSDGINSNSYASAVTNNDYIKTTITIPAGNSKIRLTGAALRTTSTAYKWSMAVVDLSTSNFTTFFQDINVPAYSDVISASAATPYEMLPGKSYDVRWYMNTGSVTSTNVNIDNCDLQFEPLLSAPVVGTVTQLTPCTTATGSVVLSGLSSTNPWTIRKTPGGQTYAGSGSSTTITGLSAGTYTFSVNYFLSSHPTWYSVESCEVTINSNPDPPSPTFTAQPGISACIGSNVTYSTQASMSNYVWGFPGTAGVNYTILSGGSTTDNTVTLKYLTTGNKTVTINYTDSHSCTAASATSSTATTINTLPTPSFTIQPGANACLAENVTYTTQSGQSNYVWNVPGVLDTDYHITSGGNSTSNTVTLKWLTGGNKTVTVNYSNSNNCPAASPVSSSLTNVSICNTPPVIVSDGGGATASVNVAENTTFVTNVMATDSDLPAQNLSFTISGGADALKFNINLLTGSLVFVTPPDFENPADIGVNNTYDVQVTVTDNGIGNLTDIQDISVHVTNVNESPVLASIEGPSLSYIENNGPAAVSSSITVTDVDDSSMESATVAITGNFIAGQDVLAFTNQNGINGSYNAGTGVLTLAGSSSKANYQTALRSIAYTNSSENPSTATRTMSYIVNDGTANSNTATRNITVSKTNDAPVLASIEGLSLSYSENEGSVEVTSSITVSDVDDTSMEGATVAFTTYFVPGEDLLGFTNQNGITGSLNAGTGVLTLTGPATKANYQAALRSITYNNSSENPSTIGREISYTVNDGELNSNTRARTINVSRVNDAPVLASIEDAALSYTENAGPVTVTSTITVSDVDDTNMEGATVAITGNYYNGEDILSFTNTINITVSWNAASGTLTLSGSDTKANYQSALRSITYTNSSENPSTSTRTVSYTVNDGDVNSNTQTRAIAVSRVNDAPVLASIEDASLSYTENSGPVAVTSSITVGDVDDTNMESAIVAITGNYYSTEDRLSFTGTSSITANWNATIGKLTLSGSDSKANYQAALRSITYSNSSENPSTSPRTLSYTVNDGDFNSNIATRVFTVSRVNDAPVAVADSYSVNEGAALTVNAGTGVLSNDADAEGNTLSAIKMVNPLHGTITLNSDGSFTYTHDGSETTSDSFTYKVNDGTVDGNTVTVSIIVNPVNDPPVSRTESYGFFEGMISNTPVSTGVLVNDADAEGDHLTVIKVTDPVHGILTLNPNGSFTYTHDGSETTSDSFSYKANDGIADGNIVTVPIIILPFNDWPVANPDAYSVNEGGTLNIVAPGILANDTDAEGGNLTAVKSEDPAHGVLTLNPDGSFTYVHDGSETTSDAFKYWAFDGNSLGNLSEVTITVNPVNDAPIAVNDAATINEDTTLNGTSLLANDSDAEGNTLTIDNTPVSGPAHGLLSINTNGTYTYTPSSNYNGSDSFTYKVCDNGIPSRCSTATVNITVNAVNDSPVAISDNYTVNEGATLNADSATGVLSNDTDPEGSTLNPVKVSDPSHGTLTLNPDGSFSYTHDGSETTSDSFSYKANDGTVSGNTVVVNITVTPVNDAPIANNDNYTINEDGTLNGPSLLGNDNDPEGNNLTIDTAPVSGPAHGTLTINPDGTYLYRPSVNYNGSDSFSYKVCDDGIPSKCSTAVVTITVNAINDAPLAVNDAAAVNEDGILNGSSLLSNDSDPEGNSLTIDTTPLSGPSHGTLTIVSDGTYTYIPVSNYNGSDSFTYRVCDNGSPSLCSTAVVTIIINAVNDAPVPGADVATVDEDGVFNGSSLLANDIDPEGNNLTISTTPVNGPSHGILTISTNGTYTYKPNADYNGGDSFTYRICDNGLPSQCATAIVTISVNAINDSPNAVADIFEAKENTEFSGNVLDNDADTEGNNLSVTINPVQVPQHGTVTLSKNGSFSYKPIIDFLGTDSFTYEVCDNGNPILCSTAKVTITVKKDENCEVFVPNAFSPNADGIHDYYKIRCLYNYTNPVIEIFNRWGNLVYKKEHYGDTDYWGSEAEAWWNGYSDNKLKIGKGELPVGTYYYILKLNSKKVLTGFLFLNR